MQQVKSLMITIELQKMKLEHLNLMKEVSIVILKQV